MNNLSWMIYFADIAGSFGTVLSMIAVVLFMLTIGVFVHHEEADYRLLSVSLVTAFLACIIPSSSTIYAITASEMGEEVLNSETGGKAIRALDAWLDRQIAGETEQRK